MVWLLSETFLREIGVEINRPFQGGEPPFQEPRPEQSGTGRNIPLSPEPLGAEPGGTVGTPDYFAQQYIEVIVRQNADQIATLKTLNDVLLADRAAAEKREVEWFQERERYHSEIEALKSEIVTLKTLPTPVPETGLRATENAGDGQRGVPGPVNVSEEQNGHIVQNQKNVDNTQTGVWGRLAAAWNAWTAKQ